jgi:hypothetical protein
MEEYYSLWISSKVPQTNGCKVKALPHHSRSRTAQRDLHIRQEFTVKEHEILSFIAAVSSHAVTLFTGRRCL